MPRLQTALLSLALLPLAGLMPAAAQPQWQVTNTMHIGGEGGWDYVTVDSSSHRLFVTRSTHTQVIDAVSGRVLGDIPGQKRSHGVALVPAVGRGFITDGGGDGAIVIFDLKTYSVISTLPTMPDSDGIIYDAGTNTVLAVSGDKGKLMFFKPDIDPANGKVDSIDLGGAPEFLQADGNGKVFVNLEDKDMVAEVDLNSRKVIARWPVAPGGHPVGMALDKKAHRLLIGCRNPQKLVIMSTDDGKVVGSVPIGAGVDATQVDGAQAFASCRDGKLIVAGEKGGSYAEEQTVTTPEGARTMGLDTAAHKLYLPTAEFEAASGGGRPKMKPNTFIIVEVSRK
ncbi:MAG TPA: YncE family protein [Terracidiphilus sp.]|nr:YncE family protein [Terracidiphilus sp.]